MSDLWITIIFTVAAVGIFVIALSILLIAKARQIEREIKRTKKRG